MVLGEWIDTLAALPADYLVEMDTGNLPTRLCSWRGVYAELTLDSEPPAGRYGNRPVEPRTVAALLKDARAADGKTFEGYKGGDYAMSLTTPIWADEWGDYSRRIVTGVAMRDTRVVVTTFVIGGEYA